MDLLERPVFWTTVAVVAVPVIGCGFWCWRKIRTRQNLTMEDMSDVEDKSGVVILYQFPPVPHSPNLSPFCLKLETYLKMANIPYELGTGFRMSSKGKMPWISLDSKEVTDSAFIIEALNKKFDVNLTEHLNETEMAIGHAFQRMIEENLFWCLVFFMWIHGKKGDTDLDFLFSDFCAPVAWLIRRLSVRSLTRDAHGQGIGRHSKEEVLQIALKDLRAISTFLGDKSFLFGEKPSVFDCPMFGMMSFFVWCSPGLLVSKIVKDEMPNISSYCHRMKERFWPDWDKRCSQQS